MFNIIISEFEEIKNQILNNYYKKITGSTFQDRKICVYI
jgi:hypothetical protein